MVVVAGTAMVTEDGGETTARSCVARRLIVHFKQANVGMVVQLEYDKATTVVEERHERNAEQDSQQWHW